MGRSTLPKIVVTERVPSIVGGEAGKLTVSEVWAARTLDGVWEMRREDRPGTPWVLLRVADKRSGGTYGTLRACRVAIADGTAAFEVARCQACEGSGNAYEWRTGLEYALGHIAWEKVDGVVRYKHAVGLCTCCGGSGQVQDQKAA